MDDEGSEPEDELRSHIKKLVKEQQDLRKLIDASEALLKEKKKTKLSLKTPLQKGDIDQITKTVDVTKTEGA